MKHETFQEWIQLALTDELGPADRQALEEHLRTCADCRAENERLKTFRVRVRTAKPVEVTDQLLTEARQQFRATLRSELSRPSLWHRFIDAVESLVPHYRVAFGSVALLAVGFLGGYMMFASAATESFDVPSSFVQMAASTSPLEEQTRINNVQFIDSDASDGEVEFTFEAVRPVRMKGKVNDPAIQRVLTQALLTDQNPGVRLRTVNTLASQAQPQTVDHEIKGALIGALKADDNPAVRKEALSVLSRFPLDSDIKQALLHVLEFDRNAALRIEAIKVFETMRDKAEFADDAFLRALQEKMAKDDNNYIRIRARALFEEVRQ
jgi:hypothetical protein